MHKLHPCKLGGISHGTALHRLLTFPSLKCIFYPIILGFDSLSIPVNLLVFLWDFLGCSLSFQETWMSLETRKAYWPICSLLSHLYWSQDGWEMKKSVNLNPLPPSKVTVKKPCVAKGGLILLGPKHKIVCCLFYNTPDVINWLVLKR